MFVRLGWYWEVIVVSKKVAFAFAGVYLQPIGVDIQATTGILIIMISQPIISSTNAALVAA